MNLNSKTNVKKTTVNSLPRQLIVQSGYLVSPLAPQASHEAHTKQLRPRNEKYGEKGSPYVGHIYI